MRQERIYIAVEMPDTGRFNRKVRYFNASPDIRAMIKREKKLGNTEWKQQLLEALLVVPIKYIRDIKKISDSQTYAHLARIIGITSKKPKWTIASSRSQFIMADIWTDDEIESNYLKYVQHDYNTATKQKIAEDWNYWRQPKNRVFYQKIYRSINE